MGQRPPHLKPPAHWTNDPAPTPDPIETDPAGGISEPGETLSPTRYGDWEHKGIAVDF